MNKRLAVGLVLALSTIGVIPASDDWPQWGGPDRDFTVAARELSRSWGEEGPARLWQRPLGGGFASIVSDGTRRGFATANLLRVGDQYLLLDFDGELGLVELSGEGMHVVTRATINDEPTWTPPTLIGTTLYVRDESRIMALDLSAGKAR